MKKNTVPFHDFSSVITTTLESLIVWKSFHSLLCAVLTHMADSSDPVKQDREASFIFIQSQDQKKAHRKRAQQPGVRSWWHEDEKETQVAEF